MKFKGPIPVICFILLCSLYSSPYSKTEVIGRWHCDEKWNNEIYVQNWDFLPSGRFEYPIYCNGPCEGTADTFYLSEAGYWNLKNDSLVVVTNEKNGRTYKDIIMRFKIEKLTEDSLKLLFVDKEKEIKLPLYR